MPDSKQYALVVEADSLMRALLCLLLSREDLDVVAVSNGRRGIARALEQVPALVVCDHHALAADGFKVLHTLRTHEATKDVPFLFMTSDPSSRVHTKCLDEGADACLEKPFSVDTFVQVASVLAQPHRCS